MSDLFFNFLLFCLNVALKTLFIIASIRSRSFRKKLERNRFALLIKTIDGKNARYYRIVAGMMKSRKGDYPDPDVSVVWADTRAFNSILFKINPLSMAKGIIDAIQDNKLVIEADLESAGWFLMMMGEMLLVYRYFFSRKID